jgi:Holliday junction resolvase RusA-like endonuclease
MRSITFEVAGDPVPQPRARVSKKGWAYTPSDHKIHAYRAAIAAAARAAGAKPTEDAPLTVIIDLVFARPKSHFRKSGLREDAPRLPRPDCSNVLKGIEDALNGVVWSDDTQLGRVVIEKTWGTEGSTTVRIC